MQKGYISLMNIMRLASFAVLSFALAGGTSTYAAGAAVPAPSTAAINMSGQVVVSSIAGGMADPVPLFASASGPVLFVVSPTEPEEVSPAMPHAVSQPKTLTTTHIGQR